MIAYRTRWKTYVELWFEAHRVSGQCSLSRVRCSLVASDERKLIGRANRRLHREELKRFRAQGRRAAFCACADNFRSP